MVSTISNSILIIEDNPKVNNMFCKQLSASGLKCQGVSSLREALKQIEADGPPAVIILDLELPDGHGTQVLDFMHEKGWRDTRVIVVSAHAFTHDTTPYRVDHTLVKPISPRGLSLLVHELLPLS